MPDDLSAPQSPHQHLALPVDSARTFALMEAYDGPPRQGVDATSSVHHPILMEILPQIAGEFAPICRAETRRVLEIAVVCINELFRRAKAGEEDGLVDLCQAAMSAVRLLDLITDTHLDAARAVARTMTFWPVYLNLKPEYIRLVHDQLRSLQLGEDCLINLKPTARWSMKNPITQWVGMYHTKIVYEQHLLQGFKNDGHEIPEADMNPWYRTICALPPLTKATADEWLDKGIWPLVLTQTDGHPEKDEKLRRFGVHRAKHRSQKPGSKTADADIRDGIKKAFRQTLRNLASAAASTPAR